MALDLAAFEALQAQVEALTAKLNGGSTRTPAVRTPLTNLLHPPPSATLAKPNFFYEGMDTPHNPGTPFPALRFRLTENGVEERCCRNAAEVLALGDEWSPIPPSVELPSPLDSIQEAMESLTEDEKRVVMQEQQKTRLAAIQQMLANLTPEELAALQSGVPAKRRPGRPKTVKA